VLALEEVFNLLVVQPMKDGRIKEPARLRGWHGGEIREWISLNGRIRSRNRRKIILGGRVQTEWSAGVGRVRMRGRRMMELGGSRPSIADHGLVYHKMPRIANKQVVPVG
jgi:hypothetical protein